MNIKILVCYHKKDFLFKNDVLVPIHCGRAVAKEKHKDGQISDKDYNWLLDNMIGDDTGDNISHLNREVNEMTAIYWAWKNYDKLGNPDYIGLCHYRRLFNFRGAKYIYNKNHIMSKSGQTTKNIAKTLKGADFITRTPISCDELKITNMECFQDILKLSDTHCPELYKSFKWMQTNKKYFCTNMFIMSRDDFFAYCSCVFPVMFDFLKLDNRGDLFTESVKRRTNPKMLERIDDGKIWLPRLTGYLMEYITAFYLVHMMKTKKHKEIGILNTEECVFSWRKIFRLKHLFSINRTAINGVVYRTICLLGFSIKIKRIKNA